MTEVSMNHNTKQTIHPLMCILNGCSNPASIFAEEINNQFNKKRPEKIVKYIGIIIFLDKLFSAILLPKDLLMASKINPIILNIKAENKYDIVVKK